MSGIEMFGEVELPDSPDERCELSRAYGVPAIDLLYFEIFPLVLQLVPRSLAFRHFLIPICRVGSILTVAMVNPGDLVACDEVRFVTGLHVEPIVASPESIRDALAKYYPAESELTVEDIESSAIENADIEVIEDPWECIESSPVMKTAQSAQETFKTKAEALTSIALQEQDLNLVVAAQRALHQKFFYVGPLDSKYTYTELIREYSKAAEEGSKKLR
jgi:hypothetical protein